MKVWDLPTRLFHWTLAVFVLFSLYTGYFGGVQFKVPRGLPGAGHLITNLKLHLWSGVCILTLTLFRLIWGFVGSSTARFATFVRGPGAVINAVNDLRPGRNDGVPVGHNPLGALMILLLLGLLLLQAGTGLFLASDDDILPFRAPLNHLVTEATADRLAVIHSFDFWLLTVLVSLHVLAVFYYLVVKKQNLVATMVTGRQRKLLSSSFAPLRFVSTRWALIALAAASGLVWLLV